MILVAATAFGLVALRLVVESHDFQDDRQGVFPSMIQNAIWGILPFLTMWTLAVPLMVLCRSRRRSRRPTRRPGIIACCTATLTIQIVSSWWITVYLTQWFTYGPGVALDGTALPGVALLLQCADAILDSLFSGYPAYGVAGAWLTLVLAGWWRSEPSGIDRLGRLIGFTWIAIDLVGHGLPFIMR